MTDPAKKRREKKKEKKKKGGADLCWSEEGGRKKGLRHWE